MIKISVFTPTYNRNVCLERVYQSLLRQTDKKFYWIIIDDGSTDDTYQLVEKWKNENLIKIEYIYQENHGKWYATNKAIESCSTDYFAFLDSDDYYIDDTISFFYKILNKYNNPDGVIGLRGKNENETMNGIKFKNIECLTYYDRISKKYKYYGETCRLYKTTILKKHKYPNINSNFIPENVLLGPIDSSNKIVFTSRILSISEYRDDGLTLNLSKYLNKNKEALLLSYRQELKNKKGCKHNIKVNIVYISFCIKEKINIFNKNNITIPTLLLIPFGVVYYILRRRKYD